MYPHSMDEQDTGPEAFLQRETASDVERSLQHGVCSCFAGHLEGVRSIHRFLGDIVVGAEEFLPGTEAVTIQE